MVCFNVPCSSFRTSQFIIGLNKYLEAVNHGFSVGMRYKMRFEGEDSPERRYYYYIFWFFLLCYCFRRSLIPLNFLISFTGTIVGVGDVSAQWSGSKWRSLKVDYSFEIHIEY